jgi:pimeloyl-ACP methyl ester carboxylesterase
MLASRLRKFLVFAPILLYSNTALRAEISHFSLVKPHKTTVEKSFPENSRFFDPSDPRRESIEAQLKQHCPSAIYPMFDRANISWRSFYANNCKELLKDAELGGEFGFIENQPKDGAMLEYAFFKGQKNQCKLIVIAGGGFFDKHFALPYLVLLNKVLGFSCLIADYRGHENSWATADQNNILYKMRNRSCGIDSSKSTFGEKEGEDFANLILKIRAQKDYLQEVHALGICFGSIVLAKAHNLVAQNAGQPLFKSIALISPLPSIQDLIINMIRNNQTMRKFFDKKTLKKIKGASWFKFLRSAVEIPFMQFPISWAITKYLHIKQFNTLAEFGKLQAPVLMIASQDSDCIVTKPMALKVWHAIPTANKALLWSYGVGHLFNWWDETAQLIIALEQFFAQPEALVQDPVKYLQ